MDSLPPPPPSRPPGATYVPRPMNGMAVASLCCSIGTLFTGFTFILGIIFGHIALSQIKRQPHQEGYGLAVAGLVVGYVFLVLAVALLLLVIILLVSWPE